MGVDHSGRHFGMTKEFLHSPDIIPVFHKMGGERVPQRMYTCNLCYSRRTESHLESFLQRTWEHAMPSADAATRVNGDSGRWKTQNHVHSFPAVGYFLSSAFGSSTPDRSKKRSSSKYFLISCICSFRPGKTYSDIRVCRSLSPLPERTVSTLS